MNRFLRHLSTCILLLCGCQCSTPQPDWAIEQLYQHARENAKSMKQDQQLFVRQAAHYRTQTKDKESLAKIAHIKAMYFHKKIDLDSALICFDEGLSLLRKDSRLRYQLLINAARDAANLKRFVRFEQYLTQAEKLAAKYKNPQYAADCAGARALRFMKVGKFIQASPYLHKADSILASNSISKDRDYYQYVLGKSCRFQREFAQAYKHFLTAEQIAIRNGNNFQLLLIYQGIARLYRTQRRYSEALIWQEKQLALAQQQNNRKEIRAGLEGMAIIYTEIGNNEKANELFHQSLNEATKMRNPEAIAVALTNLGQYNKRLGNTTQAIQYYCEALRHKKKAGLGHLSILRSYKALADACIKAGQIDQAKAALKEAMPLADSLESPLWKAKLSKSIYELYKQEKDYPRAIDYVTDYLNFQKQADTREADDKLKELMVQYESREKDQLIDLQQQQLKNSRTLAIAVVIVLVLILQIGVLIAANKRIRNKAVAALYKQHLQNQQKQALINQLLAESPPHSRVMNDDNLLLQKLNELLEQQQIFKQHDLSLDKLAQMLGTNTTYVSQLINREFKCNFNALINHHRISYCKKIICERKSETILMKEIGFEAGFSSQSTFYASFKNEVGITPLQFLKTAALQQEESICG
ncbi:tetratricopeptide repeat protein [Mangrovibacterium marinum]|uniref:Tetratricopeptide repeat protein n=1 Tax=Mangrovibacterium marinum TaxID=1639118 RepID=A0A2T5BZI1_9BACT|nr:tetratricopeptide repeat protein [Mangrovibacterium marinum]PTN07691.1 tetratricopeptide repeat protein [Mangrovibacterium marinum]